MEDNELLTLKGKNDNEGKHQPKTSKLLMLILDIIYL